MPKVSVRMYADLAKLLGVDTEGRCLTLSITGASTVGEALKSAGIDPERNTGLFQVILNDRHVSLLPLGMDTVLSEGDKILLVNPLMGG